MGSPGHGVCACGMELLFVKPFSVRPELQNSKNPQNGSTIKGVKQTRRGKRPTFFV
jgi:hypothetical protein